MQAQWRELGFAGFPTVHKKGGDPLLADVARSGGFDSLGIPLFPEALTFRSPRILSNLPIHHSRDILLRTQIPHLHHPPPFPRQLPPPARLLRILFNRLILPTAHQEPHSPQPLRSSPSHPRFPPADVN